MVERLDNVLPLVIFDQRGHIVDVALMNEKGYTKSMESGYLWTLHQKKGRLLPYNKKAGFESLRQEKRWYEAVLRQKPSAADRTADSAAAPEAPGKPQPSHQTAGTTPGTEAPGELSTPSPESAPSEFTAEHPADSAADLGETAAPSPERVLSSLLAVIRGRREQMPEGSYTSYLFGEGLEKIKKKTGEEAIELILAEKPEDIVHEASDLLYHLLVLLEATGLSWDDVSTELANRSM